MEREATLKALGRILAPDGRIVICGASVAAGEANPWRAAYETTLRSWGESRAESHRQIYEHWFDGSALRKNRRGQGQSSPGCHAGGAG